MIDTACHRGRLFALMSTSSRPQAPYSAPPGEGLEPRHLPVRVVLGFACGFHQFEFFRDDLRHILAAPAQDFTGVKLFRRVNQYLA